MINKNPDIMHSCSHPIAARTAAWRLCIIIIAICLPAAYTSAQTGDDIDPNRPPNQPRSLADKLNNVRLSPTITRLLEDPITSDTERRRLNLFHSQFDQIDNPTLTEQAVIALARYDLHHPSLTNPDTPRLLQAKAAILLSDYQRVLDLLAEDQSIEAIVLRAQAHDLLDQPQQALELLTAVQNDITRNQPNDPAKLTASAKALVTLAQLQGRPSQDYHRAMKLLAKVRDEIDPLYWPAYLLESQLLFDKDSRQDAVIALLQALELNPRCSEIWFELGRQRLDAYDFQSVETAATRLLQINTNHPLAAVLQIDLQLKQRLLPSARQTLEQSLRLHENNGQLKIRWMAIRIINAAEGQYVITLPELLQAIASEKPSPTLALLLAGKYLSDARLYDQGKQVLQAAIELRPNWPQPHIELGLLLMQQGDEIAAAQRLQIAATLDPFNLRAHNQLDLAQKLLKFHQLETEHFIIKYYDPIDEVMARDLVLKVEQMRLDAEAYYRFTPPNKTIIEIMPDTEHFAVRITGMPDLWTFAACTGDVIAMAPPRYGAKQQGPYNWPRVLRHEYDHVVTLNRTEFRIPHWFTEALAVYHEPGETNFASHQLLAARLQQNQLFNLNEISWAFVRPKKPGDRQLAYAQSAWMIQYINETFGRDAVLQLLDLFKAGTSNTDAIEKVTRQSPDEFFAAFLSWARQQVKQWGLLKPPDDPRITTLLTEAHSEDGEFNFDLFDELLADYPDQPDLLKIAARIALVNDSPRTARQALLRYASARPVDPWASQMLAKIALELNTPLQAVGPLEHLEAQSDYTASWASQLTTINRSANQLTQAAVAADRALAIEPYNSSYRETTATIYLQLGDINIAAHHIKALTILEPDHAIHFVRLAAVLARLDQPDKAKTAALKARQLDPDAPVDRFLD